MDVTIAIPTYNRATHLERCLRKVLAMPDANLRVIVSDDASADGTSDVARGFEPDPRFRYHRNAENLGLFENFNRLLALVETRFVLFLCDDDDVDHDIIPAISASCPKDVSAYVVCNRYRVKRGDGTEHTFHPKAKTSTGVYQGAALLRDLWRNRVSFQICSIIFDAGQLRSIGGFNTQYRYCGDIATYVSFFNNRDIAFLAECKSTFNVHPLSVSSSLSVGDKAMELVRLSGQLGGLCRGMPAASLADLKAAFTYYMATEYGRQTMEMIAAGRPRGRTWFETLPLLRPALRGGWRQDSLKCAVDAYTPLKCKEAFWTLKRYVNVIGRGSRAILPSDGAYRHESNPNRQPDVEHGRQGVD